MSPRPTRDCWCRSTGRRSGWRRIRGRSRSSGCSRAADPAGVHVVVPRPGQRVDPDDGPAVRPVVAAVIPRRRTARLRVLCQQRASTVTSRMTHGAVVVAAPDAGAGRGCEAKPAEPAPPPAAQTQSDVPPPLVPAMPLPDNAVDNAVAKLDGHGRRPDEEVRHPRDGGRRGSWRKDRVRQGLRRQGCAQGTATRSTRTPCFSWRRCPSR